MLHKDRKESCRFLIVHTNYYRIITQDRRRKNRFITGNIKFKGKIFDDKEVAMHFGCGFIVRKKQ